eukprot:6211820-Pleurochrysis_carterae.AAC.2
MRLTQGQTTGPNSPAWQACLAAAGRQAAAIGASRVCAGSAAAIAEIDAVAARHINSTLVQWRQKRIVFDSVFELTEVSRRRCHKTCCKTLKSQQPGSCVTTDYLTMIMNFGQQYQVFEPGSSEDPPDCAVHEQPATSELVACSERLQHTC